MSERSYYVFVCKWRGKIMNKRKRLLAILINGMLLSSLCVASAADVTAGAGNGIAYGTGSNANNTQDIAVGNKAKVENYVCPIPTAASAPPAIFSTCALAPIATLPF